MSKSGRRLPATPRIGGALLLGGPGRSPREFFAGATLAALSLPLNIGYATAAGLPASVGIYSTLIPIIVFALTTGSRHLVVGPDATIAGLLGVVVMPLVAAGKDPEEVAWAAALLVGGFLLVFWALRLGSLVRFLSRAVLLGFIAGLAVEVLTSQIRKIMGVSVEAEGWFREVWAMVKAIPDASVASIIVGVSTIAIVRVMKRVAPALPAALVALTVVTVVVAITDPKGVALLGPVPSTLPRPTFPTVGWSVWSDLIPVAMAIAALTIAEGVLLAQSNARANGEPLDPNGEIFAMGAANLASAVSGGMPIGASSSRTAALSATGARTQVPAIAAAVLVAIVVVFFTDAVAALPSAALAGLVANAVVSTIEVHEFRRLATARRTEFGIGIGCAIGVLVLGPLGGIALAAVVSMLDVVRRAADAPWAQLDTPPDIAAVGRFSTGTSDEHDPTLRGLRIVRPGGVLFFANADELRSVFERSAADPDVHWLVLDLETVGDIDPTAATALDEGLQMATSAGTVVAFSRAQDTVQRLLRSYGLVGVPDGATSFESNRAAEQAYRQAHGATTD